MKKVLILVFLLICFKINAQTKKWWSLEKNDYIVYGAQFLCGNSDGWREQVLYHWVALHREFPNLNPQWWDNAISWENKDHEPSLFVAFSDANHFFKASSLILNCTSIAFSYGDFDKYKKRDIWKVIAAKLLYSYISNKAGFLVSYNIILKNKL